MNLPRYRRDRFTWLAFAALLIFGVLNSILGPLLPFLRATEGQTYFQASAHQVAFAIGGGAAGLAGTKRDWFLSRGTTIRLGLLGMAVAGAGVALGNSYLATVTAAFVMSLFGTSALISLWAALADNHPGRPAVAMTEGEISVSLGGIVAPLLVSALAATVFGWRAALIVIVIFAVVVVVVLKPAAVPQRRFAPPPVPRSGRRPPSALLVLVFSIVALEWSLSFWLASYLDDAVGLGRGAAVVMAGVLYAAMLAGRVVASRLSRRLTSERLLSIALVPILAGLPILLLAHGPVAAGLGIAVLGCGPGPHLPPDNRFAGQRGQIRILRGRLPNADHRFPGPDPGALLVGVIAQAGGLRPGFLLLPAFAVLAAAALIRHHVTAQPTTAA